MGKWWKFWGSDDLKSREPRRDAEVFADRMEGRVREVMLDVLHSTESEIVENISLAQEVERLEEERIDLKRKVEDLRAEKEKIEARFRRKSEDIEHKVGLHRKRVEQEVELARREAELDAREDRLEEQVGVLEERAEMIEETADEMKEMMREFAHLFAQKIPDGHAYFGQPPAAEKVEDGDGSD